MRALEGPLEINTHLKQAQLLFQGDLCGPEAFVRDEQGKEEGRDGERNFLSCCEVSSHFIGFIYTGLGDGRVVRLDSDLQHYTTVTRVGKPPYDQCGEWQTVRGHALDMQLPHSVLSPVHPTPSFSFLHSPLSCVPLLPPGS